ncbi:MAG: hypothetical protein ACFFED_07130 [Candidatus Thorarchaeota archaeon]
MNSKFLQIMNVIAVIAAIVFNALVNIIPVNNITTGAVSDAFPNLFTPPGYVFAIWAVIYTLAIIFMVYQVRSNQRAESYLGQIGILYLVGSIINIVWLVVFHFSYGNEVLFPITTLLILGFLVTLLLIYTRLGIGLSEVSVGQKLGVHLHISVYLGWISLASIANIASMINVIVPGIALETQVLWTTLILIVALVLTMLMLFLRRDFAYGLVVIWASVGIATKQAVHPLIYFTALGTAIIVLAVILLLPFLKGKKNPIDFYLHRE